jgi:hypothetical protein
MPDMETAKGTETLSKTEMLLMVTLTGNMMGRLMETESGMQAQMGKGTEVLKCCKKVLVLTIG